MELRRIVLVQWHLLAPADLDIAGNAAILGQNRSGKSTLLDLIQAVMTGGSGRYHRFNKSAGEGGGRSERTLKSYSLGQLNDETFLRPEGAWTHVALVFEDPAGKRDPLSIGLSIEASLQHGAEVVGRYVAPGVKVDSGLFVEHLDQARSRSAPWSVVRPRLASACAAAGSSLLAPDGARDFVREYMRRLFTGHRMPEPERFLRAFILALSFVDMSSVEQFVTTFLLEKKDIDIGELRGSIQRYREIQATIRELGRRLEALRALQALIEQFREALEEEETARAVERLALLIEAGAALRANLLERKVRQRKLEHSRAELARVDAEIERQQEDLAAIRRQLATHDATARQAIVQLELKDLDREHSEIVSKLQGRWLEAARIEQLLEHRDRLAVINPGELIRSLEAVRAASGSLSPPDWPSDPARMDRLLDGLRRAAASHLTKAIEHRDDAIGWSKRIQGEIREAQDRLEQARAGRVSLEPSTLQLIELLRREGMRPRTICDMAEVVDERWRGVAEALLIRDREAIVVDPEHASRATTIMRHTRECRRCRVANTRRLAGNPAQPRTGTLASVLRSEDPLATAFIVQRIGNVTLAESQEQLLAGGRAVMDDGAYCDGLVTEMRLFPDPKIGLAAAPLMQASLSAKVEELRSLLGVHEANARFFEDVARRLEHGAREVGSEDRLDRLVLLLAGVDERRAEARGRLSRIAASVDPALLDAERRADSAISGLRGERDGLIREGTRCEAAIRAVDDKLGAGEGMPGSRLSVAQRRRLFRDAIRSTRALSRPAERYKSLRPRPPGRIAEEMSRRASEAREAHRDRDRDVRLALGRYAIDFPDACPEHATAPIVAAVRPWVAQGIEALEGNELIRYLRHADEAADRIARLFRTTFIHELNSRFAHLDNEIAALTSALKARPLHSETYSLHASIKPEYEDLRRLVGLCERDETVLDALFGRGEPRDEAHARALRQVERLFADETLDFSAYEDYRKYFTFDLRMKDVVTGRVTPFDRRRGTASGAERQVPFYVVIGAALASICHGARRVASKDDLGLGLAVFDEAFSKMDGPNQRTLLDFYGAIGLQVLIAAPPEKRAAVYENLDTIIDVFRSGDQAVAEAIAIKPRTRREMRAANPQHLADADLASMVERPQGQAAE